MSELKRTPLYPLYEKWGGKTVNYEGGLCLSNLRCKTEHEAVRTRAGLLMFHIWVKFMFLEKVLYPFCKNANK